jgi:LysM repeat protein
MTTRSPSSSFVVVFALSIVLPACQTTKPTTSQSSPYVSNAVDGGYHPYPDGGGGIAQSGGTVPQYDHEPPPPPPGFENPAGPPKRNVVASSSPPKSTTKSKPATVASRSSSSAAKPKPKAVAKPVAKKAAPKPTGSVYTVVAGDTLYGIARKRGTTVPKIKAASGLSADKLKIGQKLTIP